MNDSPNSHAQQAADHVRKLLDDQIARAASVADQMDEIERQGLDQARALVDQAVAATQGALGALGRIAATPPAFDAWKTLAGTPGAHAGAVADEIARAQGKGIEQARAWVGEMGHLGKETLSWACALPARWRKVGLEVARASAAWTAPGTG